MKTAVIYARYSSDKQTEQSIEGQLRVCNDYAEKHDILVVDTYIDRAMTGTNDNRYAFQKMLKDSDKRAWDIVLVYKLDRFSRNKYEMAMHKKTLKDNGIKIVSAMENIPDTPEGIILESLLEGMAEYYSAELSQKVKRGMNEALLKGNCTGGIPLYGYKFENKKVAINEDEAEIVRFLFQEYSRNRLVVDIRKELQEKGILYRGKPFARNTLYNLLKNEKYIGNYTYSGKVYNNIYPAIVSKDVFDKVRIKVEKNKTGKHKPDVVYLLKDTLICAYCGNPVSSESGTSKNGNVKRYYKCYGRKSIKNHCCLKPIRKEILEETIINSLTNLLNSKNNILKITNEILKLNKIKNNDNVILNILNKNYCEVGKAIENILHAIEQGIISSSTKEYLDKLEKQKVELQEKILIEKAKNKTILKEENIKQYLMKALKLNGRQLIEYLIKEVKIYNDKIEIYLKQIEKQSPDDTKHQGFSLYKEMKEIVLETHKINRKPKIIKMTIEIFI